MNFKNIKLILGREYYTRVTSKSFIWGTILTPIGIGLLIYVSTLIMSHTGDEVLKIAILDKNESLSSYIKNSKSFEFSFSDLPLDSLKKQTEAGDYNGVLLIPKLDSIQSSDIQALYYSDKQLGLEMSESLKTRISKGFRKYKMNAFHVEQKTLKLLETSVELNPEPLKEGGKDRSSFTSMVAAAIGGIMGFAMYMVVYIYGMMIMRSVMEEKTSRIVEVIMSSVKPIDLMVGKILGVGAVGLTQLAFWMVLIPLILFGVTLTLGDMEMMTNPGVSDEMMQAAENLGTSGKIGQIIQEVTSLNWWLILPLFIFYFLGGFFLYSSLFAAVGSAIGDDVGESQSLTLPISLPVIIAVYIMMSAIRDPNTSLAVWASIFPLFSPIVMPARLAFDPPMWQIAASVVSLILGVLFFAWLSARIYRVGILMYGKKVSFKQLAKWMFSGQ